MAGIWALAKPCLLVVLIRVFPTSIGLRGAGLRGAGLRGAGLRGVGLRGVGLRV